MRLARQVYYELGPDRSIPKLRAKLSQLAAEGKPTAPRHNNTLTRWRREHAWDEWCARMQELEIEASMERTREKRERAVDIMSTMLDDAHAQLHYLITNSRDERVKLEAIKTLYNRVGVVEKKDQGVVESQEPTAAVALPPRPGPDASPEEKRAWLAALNQRAG